MRKKNYASLDMAKFLCAWLIIILHTAPFGAYSKAMTFGLRHIVTVVAVPFFFATSGFLFCKKLEQLPQAEKGPYVKKYALRIVGMYLFWSVVYFGFVVLRWQRKGGVTLALVLEYVRDFFFEGSFSTIWYLPALLSAVLLVWLLRKRLSYRAIFAIAVAVHLFTLGGTSYYGLTTQNAFLKGVYDAYYTFFDTMKNGVLFGFCYVAMGGLISQLPAQELRKPGKDTLCIGVVWVCLAAEAVIGSYFHWRTKGCDTVLCLIPLTWLLTRFVLKVDIHNERLNRAALYCRKLSILMFLTQRLPLTVIELFFADTVVYTNTMLYFIVVSVVTLAISAAIIRLSEQKLPWLKRVY